MSTTCKIKVFWQCITADIKNAVSTCEACQTHQNKQASEPLLPHEVPAYPWQKIGTDIFDFIILFSWAIFQNSLLFEDWEIP